MLTPADVLLTVSPVEIGAVPPNHKEVHAARMTAANGAQTIVIATSGKAGSMREIADVTFYVESGDTFYPYFRLRVDVPSRERGVQCCVPFAISGECWLYIQADDGRGDVNFLKETFVKVPQIPMVDV